MNITGLLDLAKRCETAAGPDRDLDLAVWRAIPGHSQNADKSYLAIHTPRYTSSLDAAGSLIPAGYDWILERTNDGLTIGARVGHNDPDRTSWGGSPALALCAAALRARAGSLSSALREGE